MKITSIVLFLILILNINALSYEEVIEVDQKLEKYNKVFEIF